MESEPMLTPREKIPSTGGSDTRRVTRQDSEPNLRYTSYVGWTLNNHETN